MATYPEKDVLLEIACVGYLMPEELTDEMEADLKKMGEIRWEILCTEPENIDYEATVKKIKEIKSKYEKKVVRL